MRYGDILPEGFNIPTSAFWLRADLEKRNPFELVLLRSGDTVMDCGAYIGTFAAACLEQAAARVTCYEAAPKNAILLRGNMQRYAERVSVIEGALVASDAETVDLTMSGFSGANSTLPSANRKKFITVPAVNFRNELLHLLPDVVKIDVEGAEYELLGSLQPGDLRSLTCLFIEFHPITDREAKIAAIRAFIEAEGLTVINARNRAFTAVRK